ncbi:hypothetical protein RhiirC2_858439 [Rhizophagus irregularis]|uniref:Uncharacterized protein n=1 Tax=Rhizophagus irregularis TaxID=588596 RepID=A0A2N1M5E0_9GLOM|nr:hypothetical protein RhiirC2_858439 [Rhizophagus irregularis]
MDILRANNILVPTLKTPFINYASFCKKFLLDEFFHSDINKIFNNELNDEKLRIVSNEIIKLLVNQASLKDLYVYDLGYLPGFIKNENRFFSSIPHSIIDLTISGINIDNFDNLLINYIARSCQNIKEIYIGLDSRTNLDIFEMFIKELQYLESIKINISGNLNEKELFEIIKDCSQENFYKIEFEVFR